MFKGLNSEPTTKNNGPKASVSQNYQRECLEYEKYIFDNRIKMIIRRMAIHAYTLFKNEK